ncbi:MAG: glycoside hydrolase, partial [Rhodobacter sp.]|nr:glycoside hydrolase [Rhodobacter sp.]
MIRSISLVILVALAACGQTRREAAPEALEVSVTSSNFSDSDPTDWPGRSPDRYPVHGIDLSRFQTQVDWT